ncbi:SIR2 family protein [Vibrio parahaemolyticus]|nr:SIR2 family protein [Vibrio parahaemolyticus]
MAIPNQLIEQIKRGKVVLFLGSGALYGAALPDNKPIPLGNGLRDLLCDQYLEGSFKEESLAHVADIAITQAGLFDVQDFIRNYFRGLQPAEFHRDIPKYKWRAIFTTNYDDLVETVYQEESMAIQSPHIVLSNSDPLDSVHIGENKVPLVKLHGCVTRTRDAGLPLILTTDQYNDCNENRDRLFKLLYELAIENTIVFIGHSLQDFNIRSILLDLLKAVPHGQRHFLLKPGLKAPERDLWSTKKINAIDETFEGFLKTLSEHITPNDLALASALAPTEHPIESYLSSSIKPTQELIDFLNSSVDLVDANVTYDQYEHSDFFKGVDQGWFSLVEDIPIKRNQLSKIMEEVVERPEAERNHKTDFYAIKAEAGSGKTVFLRQIAWETQQARVGIVLWVKDGASVDYDLIEELAEKANERVFLFWDNAAINAIELYRFLQRSVRRRASVTIITAERVNEWNTRCGDLDELLTDHYTLNYLSENEIDDLVKKLEQFDCLGPNLESKTHEQRCNELSQVYGRQLLVALHEATMGEPFEDIIFHEYENITPLSAQKIYLTVSTLNRMKVPVRAGLISRIYDISFDDFKETFYKPLEKVVITKGNETEDLHYQARHSQIAEILFHRALSNVEDRYQEYISIISKLNISFSSDRTSFRALVKAKSLNELFPNYEDVSAIYKHAQDSIGDDSYLLQQMANYERIRPNGNLETAITLLEDAAEKAPYDPSILHSLSVVWRDKSKKELDLGAKKRCRAEARAYLDKVVTKFGDTAHVLTMQIELAIESFKDLLTDEKTTDRAITDTIRQIESQLVEGKQKYPSESTINKLEASLANILGDEPKALRALQDSFSKADRDPYMAIRLSNTYLNKGEGDKAKEVLLLALERRHTHHKLNFTYAELLRSQGQSLDAVYYYRRAFTPGDNNYQSQFWYARYQFGSQEAKEHELALDIFTLLRKARMPFAQKHKVRDYEGSVENPIRHYGTIVRKRSNFGFIAMDGSGYEIFLSPSSVEEGLYDAMKEGDRVTFDLGFAFSGPVACSINV